MMVVGEHFTTIAETLVKYRERGFLCDTVLVAKCGSELKAHSALLAAVSPVFMTALEGALSTGPYHLCFPEVELNVLEIAVHFIYTGKLLLPTVYSRMEQLTKLFSKMTELGLNLQKLHGCEMTFVRKLTQKEDIKKAVRDSEADYSGTERNYHRSSKTDRRKTNPAKIVSEIKCTGGRVSAVPKPDEVMIIDLSNEIGNESQVALRRDEELEGGISRGHDLGVSQVTQPSMKSASKSKSKLRTKPPVSVLKPFVISQRDVSAAYIIGECGGEIDGIKEAEVGSKLEIVDTNRDQHSIVLSEKTEMNVNHVRHDNLQAEEEAIGQGLARSCSDGRNGLMECEEDSSIYKYFCEFCEEKDRIEFRTEYELSLHKTKLHWDQCHRCKTCGRKFCSQKGLRTHMKMHLETQPLPRRRRKFKCAECSMLFHTSAALDGHRSKHTGEKPWSCGTCGQRFTMRSSLERHQHLHSGYKPYLCDFCGKGFVEKWNLSEHMINVHSDAEQEYECALCGSRFRHRSAIEKHVLEAHQLTHLEKLKALVKQSEAYLCDFCGKNLLSVKALKVHVKLHSNRHHKCETCDKTFSSHSALYMHRKIHSGEKPYVCEVCQKGFRQKPAFDSHVVTHSQVRPFVCIVCSKSFANKSQLKQHMVLHGDERAYTCGICHKQFATKSYFTLHNRMHVGVKPFTCIVCGFAFALKHHLKRHMRVHTGEKPFICQVCDKRYKNNVDLRYHYTRFHKLDFERISINNRSKYIFKLDDVANASETSIHNPSGCQSTLEFAE